MSLEMSSWLGLCAVLLVAAPAPASAQNQRYYPQPQGGYSQPPPNYQQPAQGYGYGYPQQQPQTRYENPIEFLPKFGKRMGEMVRRVFYGKDATGYDHPQQGYNSRPNNGYSLEEHPRQYSTAPAYPQQPTTGIYPPPSSYPQQPQGGYQYPPQQRQPQAQQQQPRYSYPPQTKQPLPPAPATTSRSQKPAPQTRSSPPAPAPQSKSSTRTYSPPRVSQTPPKTTTPKPAPKTVAKPKEQPPAPAPTPTPPPPPTTARRSESTPPSQTASNTSSLGSGSFLKGRKASKPGRVISPYPPYKELDITGLESGSLAMDPTTQKVFEVP